MQYFTSDQKSLCIKNSRKISPQLRWETNTGIAQIILDKDVKAVIITIIHMFKKIEERSMMKTEIEEIKDIQSKHLQIKNTIAEMKNTLNELPSY